MARKKKITPAADQPGQTSFIPPLPLDTPEQRRANLLQRERLAKLARQGQLLEDLATALTFVMQNQDCPFREYLLEHEEHDDQIRLTSPDGLRFDVTVKLRQRERR